LVAFSSVSHMGFVVLGMFALNATGLDGSSIQMLNHGLTTGALFACVGMIYERYHTRDLTMIGGLWNRLPLLAFFLILAALGSAAVPGFNGFVGEFPILVGTFETSRRAAVLGATGMILGACYLLWMVRKVIFGPLLEPMPPAGEGAVPAGDASTHGTVPPVGWHEIAGLTPLMVLIVAIGVYPRPFTEQMASAITRIDEIVQTERAEARRLAATPPLKSGPFTRGGRGATAKSKGQSTAKGKGAAPKSAAPKSAAPKGAPPATENQQTGQAGPSSPAVKPLEKRP